MDTGHKATLWRMQQHYNSLLLSSGVQDSLSAALNIRGITLFQVLLIMSHHPPAITDEIYSGLPYAIML